MGAPPHKSEEIGGGERIRFGVGRQLLMLSPPGLEGFFRELGEAERDGTLGPEAYARVSEKYGITWIDE